MVFLQRYLTARMEEQGDLALQPDRGVTWPSVQVRVEKVLMAFFCNAEWIGRCRRTSPKIDKQVELWNYLAQSEVGRVYNDIAAIAISIISIPASEASCERSFSRQKRLMVHSRGQSKKDLVIARIMFAEFGPFLDLDQGQSDPTAE
jgi:thiol-disulfide isomerase/thioredoxin